MKKNITKNTKNKLLKGGVSARLGTINLKCPNMDCGTAGLPGFHPSWNKVGGYRQYLQLKKQSTNKSKTKSKKRVNTIKNKSKTKKHSKNKNSENRRTGKNTKR